MNRGQGRRAFVIGLPYLWLLVFVLLPALVVLAISFAETRIGSPPFTPPLSFDGGLQFNITADNYLRLFSDHLYADAFLSSIRIAAMSALITLLIAYPMAYGIARAGERSRPALLMLVV